MWEWVHKTCGEYTHGQNLAVIICFLWELGLLWIYLTSERLRMTDRVCKPEASELENTRRPHLSYIPLQLNVSGLRYRYPNELMWPPYFLTCKFSQKTQPRAILQLRANHISYLKTRGRIKCERHRSVYAAFRSLSNYTNRLYVTIFSCNKRSITFWWLPSETFPHFDVVPRVGSHSLSNLLPTHCVRNNCSNIE